VTAPAEASLPGRASQPAGADCDAAGFVLAGGLSRRMGREKALIEFGGRPLIVHALEILLGAGLPASIAGAQANLQAFAPVIHDANPGAGPLAGICAALAATHAQHVVFISVDLPFVPPSLVAFLLHHARVTGRAITIATVAGFAQTFPAVIAREALPALASDLNAGSNGCFAAFEAAAAGLGQAVSRVSVECIAQSGHVFHPNGIPPAQWFLNLNTPSEMERAEALRKRRIA
jgi:molybdopterin-guanine dinucleotide biosynthesis protein A